jgi:hypothetical protein
MTLSCPGLHAGHCLGQLEGSLPPDPLASHVHLNFSCQVQNAGCSVHGGREGPCVVRSTYIR